MNKELLAKWIREGALNSPGAYAQTIETIRALAACEEQSRLKANRQLARLKRSYLYFILCDQNVKIGRALDPYSRLSELQVGSPEPLRFLAIIPNAGHRETECHQRLKHLHLRGEWFRWTEEVDNLTKEMGSADV